MYSLEWDKRTGGFRLTTRAAKTVASEIRPVFAEELQLMGGDAMLTFDPSEDRPLFWAKQNVYIYRGCEIAKINKTRYGQPLVIEWFIEGAKKLVPVDVAAMV